MKKIAVLEHAAEADRIGEALRASGIEFFVKSYHDSAYDGLFQSQRGWGQLETDSLDEAEALRLLHELRRHAEEGAE
jgi:hypothetical protein